MNLRDLHYVLLLAEYRHFGKAAEAANVSQPTLSSQIRKLEDELGVLLFERDSRNVALTPAGAAVVAEAAQVMAHVVSMREAAQMYRDPLGGTIRLGVIASLGPFLMPEFLERLGHDAPRLEVRVHEGLTDPLLVQLLNRELDAVLVASEVLHEGLQVIDLFEERFLLACAPANGLAARNDVKLADMAEGSLLLLEEGHCLRDQTLDICRVESVDCRVKATSLQTLVRMVEKNHGVTLLPALAARHAGHLVVKDVQDKDAMRVVRLVTRKNYLRSGAVAVLAEAARTEAAAAGLRVLT